MKQETNKTGKKWLWLVLGAVVLLAVAGVVLAAVLGGQKDPAAKTDGRPELYWNIDRITYTENSESGLSTREPGEDGLYHIRFAVNGEQVEFAVADKQLVNYIDVLDVMALTLDSDGVIVDVLEPDEVATVIGKSIYVQQVREDVIIANSSLAMNGMRYEIAIGDLTEIYETSGDVEPVGKVVGVDSMQPLDTIGVYGNANGDITHVYIAAHPAQSKIYWRAEQFYNSSLKMTTREPDENGVYHMDFYCDGELVTLKTRDKVIVNHVDSRDRYACSKGFLFDEEGYIIDEVDTGLGTRTVLGCERYDVTELVDGMVYTAKYWNYDGSEFSCKLAEDCVIYDVSTAALAEGRRGKQVDSLQVGDRVSIWTNADGEAAIIYVACRTVEVPAYYIPTRKYDSTLGETTRTPNSKGYYEVELLKVGEHTNKIYKTKDKALMSYLDSMTSKTVGLKVDGDIIQTVYDSECLFGYSPLTRGGTVPSVSGNVFTRMTYGKPDSTRTSIMAAECKVYNVSEVGEYGAETTLQPGDRIYAHRKPTGEAICIFVTQRMVGLDHLYWNMERQYDSTTKSTTREPDADGWYVFNMIYQGKQITLKTKSKAIASKIDAQSSCAIGLDVSGDVIVSAYSALNTSGGSVTMSGYRVKEIRDDGVITVYYGSGDTYKERSFKIKSDGVIYNVSDAYYSYKGEKVSSVKVGDMILVVTDIYAEAEVVYIRYREADNMYWRADRYYDTVNKITTRVPDTEGWYHYDLAVNGKVKSFKTNNKELATKLDAVSGAFGLVVDGDVIRSYVPTNWVRNVGFVGVTNWEVTAISGKQVTVQYTLPGSSNTGKTQTITLASGAKIYDVSPIAEAFGAETELKVGDQIRTYQNEANTAHLYVYILHRANRAEGIDGYCAHCDQVVHWNPYAGGSITRASGHYYLSGDCETTEQLGVGLENSEYEIVLDLNGKTLTRQEGGRFALVRFGDTLTVMDSVGGGAIRSYGSEGYNGGVMYVDGGHLNLLGGKLELMDSSYDHKWGGVLYLSESTFKMYGGTIVGGKAQRGGSIYNTGASIIEMSGGTITGGTTTEGGGGNIYLVSESTMKMSGGTVSNGYGATRAGNIHVDTATLEITGGTITGGSSARSDDGICVNSSKSSVKLSNVNCEDKILVRYMGEFVLSGCVKIANLDVPSGKQFTVGEMTEGSEVYITAVGKFTNEFDDAQAYVDAGYFKSAVEKMEVGVSENALLLQGEKRYCAHCDQKVVWFQWSADATIEGPTAEGEADHYYLDDDFTKHTAQRTIKGNVVLDLRGNDYTTTGIRNFLVSGNFSVMDSVGGGVMTTDGGGNDGSVAYVNGDNAVFSLYSGTLKLSGNGNVNNGGVIAVNKGSLNIYGGEIIGGTVSGNGGAIWNNRYANITIEDGMITGSVYTVGNDDKNASLVISGGTLGEVSVNNKVDVTLSGAPVIANLDLSDGKLVTLGELSQGADITVTATGIFTAGNEKAADYAGYFKSTDGQLVTEESGALRVGTEPIPAPELIACPHCGGTPVEWSEWPSTTDPASGHYYISENFTAQDKQWSIGSGKDVVLDLRGNAYCPAGIRNFLVKGTFSVVDSVGGGIMSADGSGADGTVAYISTNATFNLYGGTLQQGSNPSVTNGGILAANKGHIGIYGGTVTGGTITGNGSALWNKNYGNITIDGGTVSGSVYAVGTEDNNGNVVLSGGTVSGDVQIGSNVNVTVSGKPAISNLDLSGGKVITLSELAEGADITVTADDGAFTAVNDKAGDYAKYFKAASEKKEVLAQENVLVMTDFEASPYNRVYQKAVQMTADGVFDPANADTNGVVTADCPYCGAANAQWEKLGAVSDRKIVTGTHHYYLAGNLDENTYYYYFGDGSTTTEGAAICLHLNGYSINNTVADTSNNARAIYVETDATLTIMGEGTVSGACKQSTRGAIDVRGVLNLCGGNYVSTTTKYPVIQMRNEACTVNVYKGAVVGTQDMDATGIYLQVGVLNVFGGTIHGVSQVLADNTVSLQGTPVVAELKLASGVTATLGKLTDGADITVNADGVFTQANESAAAYNETYIKAAEGKVITVNTDNTLSMSTATVLQMLARALRLLCANII